MEVIMTESKKHHYVPQSLLRNFKYDKNKIFVFDKKRKVSYPSSIIDAGSENHFNTVVRNGKRLNFEALFQKNDDDLACLVEKIIDNRNTHCLTVLEKEKLLNVVVVQIIRTKMYRTSMKSLSEQLMQQFSEKEWDLDLEIPTENDVRESSLSSYKDFEPQMKAIIGKVGFLIQSNTNEDFIISDNPITRHNTFPYGGVGLSCHGIEVYFPISPNLTFALYCPTIIKKMNSYVVSQPESRTKTLYQSLLKGIASGIPVTLGKTTSKFLNSLQVSNSSRFLYSNSKNLFCSANEIINKNPDLAEVKTQTTLGEMGKAPINNKMPDGEWVVIHSTHDHHMFPVFNVPNEIGDFKFSIKRNNDIEGVLSSMNIKEISLFKNGSQVSHMKDVRLEFSIKNTSELMIKALHKLDFLNKIIASKKEA
jgi:hypothetical protein